MKNNPSSRDFEQVSAYLDGQLKPSERSRLEGRFKKESELKVALDELRKTRRLLRSLPKANVPRNFTLSPKMVDVKPFHRTYPAMGFVSALASILLVVVLLSDWLGGGTYKLADRSEKALSVIATMEVEKMASEAEVVEPTQEAMLAMEAPPEGPLQDESRTIEAPAEEAPLMFAAPPVETVVTVGEEITGTAGFEMKVLVIPPAGEGEAAQPTLTMLATEALTVTPTVELLPVSVETPTAAIEAATVPENDRIGEAQANGEAIEIPPPQPSPLMWLRILEGFLLFTALAAGITAIRQRRKPGK